MATRRLYYVQAKDKDERLMLRFIVAASERSNARYAVIKHCQEKGWHINWPSVAVLRGASVLLREVDTSEKSAVFYLGCTEDMPR